MSGRTEVFMNKRTQVHMFDDFQEMSLFSARLILEQALHFIQKKDIFTLVLSGGSTPVRLFELLAHDDMFKPMPWKKTHVFWGDERLVPRASEHSNFRLAWNKLLSKVEIPENNVHPMHVELDNPEENAERSEQELKDFFRIRNSVQEDEQTESRFPCLDFIILGVGQDGHTASLFPGDPALTETSRLITPVPAPDMSPSVPRLTMTLPVLNNAETVLFLVSGRNKNPVLRQILDSATDSSLPAGLVRPGRKTIWLVHPPFDAGHAQKMKKNPNFEIVTHKN